ncbi:ABC transporter substrate-binding protein, partial [Dehalococcoidia bacterium]|nr:ABC transporter substrate-binding protein [Dehalococcoidia bacterium]
MALGDMGNFDLVLVVGSTRSYLDSIYDYVIGADNDGALDPKSGWATEWTSSAGGASWTIKGRSDIQFHDGTKATSHDVKFGLDRYLNPESTLPFAETAIETIDSVAAPDSSSVVVTLKKADIFFPLTFLSRVGNAGGPSHLVPQGHIQFNGEDEANTNPVGSGPYKFDSVSLGNKLELTAVNKHWLHGIPRSAQLNFNKIPEESTRLAVLRTGDADLAFLSRKSIKGVKDAGLQLLGRQGSGVGHYRIDEQWVKEYPGYGPNPFANANVRKALDWYAIDREVLAEVYMQGVATPTMSFPSGPKDTAYKALPIPKFDQKKAKEMLAKEGYPNGFEMDLWIGPRPALPEGPDIAEQMAVWWEQVGLKVNRIPVEYSAYRSKLISGEGFDKPTAYG